MDVGWQYGSAYGGHLASCMVMGCIANRVRRGWGNWLDVLKNIPKYAATATSPVAPEVSIWEPNFVRLLHEVEGIYDFTQNPSKNALYWADTRHIDTPFFLNKILGEKQDHPRVCDMNTLVLWE